MPFGSVRILPTALACGAILLGFGLAAEASLIDYTIVMDNVNGFFDASSFSNQQVTLTMAADTSTVLPYGNPLSPFGYQNTVTPGGSASITVQVGSGPVTNITTPMSVSGVNQSSNNTLTFYLGSSISSPIGFYYVWDSSYPGAQAVLTTDQSSTNAGVQAVAAFTSNPLSLSGGGTFYVDATSANQPGSFNSAVAVPEPAAVAGLTLAAMAGVAWMQRRRGAARA